jgi:hypothetical protein
MKEVSMNEQNQPLIFSARADDEEILSKTRPPALIFDA